MKAIHLCAQTVIGLLLIIFGFYSAHVESISATRSIVLVFVYIAIGLLGGLVLPSIGAVLTTAAENGIRIASLGRRAYDNKSVVVPEIEIPPTEKVS